MSATYNDVLKRLMEERMRLGLSQKEMARLAHITQSNYSKAEKGLHRLSYEELKYFSKAKVDICYMFTGYKCVGKYVEYFRRYTYVELCCYLGIIYSLVVLNDCRSNTEQWKDIVRRVKYVPLVLNCKKFSNIFLVIRHMTDSRQKPMAEKLGVDIKKYRELEKERCLPDSELFGNCTICFIYLQQWC
ncbi:MAG: helix-turn-helix domain-containing protein [Lachnoclostridium sp.]|nr:helix-turn-helix domain-containing protein [Lachnospira sp.]MCM1249011.1 helix-turn-helix domain-containing protein [Lachnoclostridium sp.]